MAIDEAAFLAILKPRTIHKLLCKSLLPFKDGERPSSNEREKFLHDLLADIVSRRYSPTVPRGYIVENKGSYVPRIKPVLDYRDMCVYYFCIVQLQDSLAKHRVPGTYGGWQLGNPMRKDEDAEQAAPKALLIDETPYGFAYSLDPLKWMKHWRDFQRLAFQASRSDEFGAFIEFDISSYYDSINLEILERKVRERCGSLNRGTVDLLFILLRQWNRQYQGFNDKAIGLPQEESGDCSRLLANFYLQEYDAAMADLCESEAETATYIRYSDDQIIMASNLSQARRILVDAARKLHEIGLNIGTAKVREFSNREDFDHYWSFKLIELLGDETDHAKINEAAASFNELRYQYEETQASRPWKWQTVERRLVRVGLSKIDEPTRSAIVKRLLETESVAGMDAFMLENVARGLTPAERQRFFNVVDECVPIVPFNSFHLNLRRFFTNYDKAWRPIDEIDARLQELNDYWTPA